jgi:hypothetical protein
LQTGTEKGKRGKEHAAVEKKDEGMDIHGGTG